MEGGGGIRAASCLALLLAMLLLCIPSVDGDFQPGSRVSIPVPPAYEEGFEARAFVMRTAAGDLPEFKLALAMEARDGLYFCHLEVVQDIFVMWKAGCREKFVPVDVCVIRLTNDGDLVVSDGKNNVGWSTNTSRHGVKFIQLKRSGNLVLRNRFRLMVWQSFDFPCDKLLWGQKLRNDQQLLSPKSDYSLSMLNNELVLQWQGVRYWTTTVGNSDIDYAQISTRGIEFWSNTSIIVVVGPSSSSGPVHFIALDQSGALSMYTYGPPWILVFMAPGGPCDRPETCGPYGLCTDDVAINKTSTNSVSCSCLPYFHSTTPSQNCFVPMLGFCSKPVELLELRGFDTPLVGSTKNLSSKACADACMEDCTCVAATSTHSSICYMYTLLGSIRRKPFKRKELKMFVKVPKGLLRNESGKAKKIHMSILILGACLDMLALILICGGVLYYLYVYKRKRRESSPPPQT